VLGGEDVGFFAKNVMEKLFQIQIFEYPVIRKSIQLQEGISRAATHSSTSVKGEELKKFLLNEPVNKATTFSRSSG
jgi:hypothetical protein